MPGGITFEWHPAASQRNYERRSSDQVARSGAQGRPVCRRHLNVHTVKYRYGPCIDSRYPTNRYYDPAMGQFLTVDPMSAVTGQPYSYAGSDPANFTDPSGLCQAKKKNCGLNPFCQVQQHWRGIVHGAAVLAGEMAFSAVGGAVGPLVGAWLGDQAYKHPSVAAQVAVNTALVGLTIAAPETGIPEVLDEAAITAEAGGAAVDAGVTAGGEAGGAIAGGAADAAEGGGPWFAVTNETANRAGTLVPTSFDLSVAGEDFSVVPNATKHIAEYATSTGAGSMPISPDHSRVHLN